MLILGLGLGMVMQVLVLAVQNAVPYDMLGVATSGATLFRSIGGALGTAILGAIFTGRLTAEQEAGKGQIPAFTDSLHIVFLVATAIIAVAFVLSLVHPGAAAAQDGRDRRRRGAGRPRRHRLGARAHARAEPRRGP